VIMSERIRGSYDDALYKSTYTLGPILYFTLLQSWRQQWVMSIGCMSDQDGFRYFSLIRGSGRCHREVTIVTML